MSRIDRDCFYSDSGYVVRVDSRKGIAMLHRKLVAAAIATLFLSTSAQAGGLEFGVNNGPPPYRPPPPPPPPPPGANWFVIRRNDGSQMCFTTFIHPGDLGGQSVARVWNQQQAFNALQQMRANGVCR